MAGAGLAGSLLGVLLSRAGFKVSLYEARPDPRKVGYEEGRSINLALAERGLHALRQAGLEREVMAQAIMMRGRMVHVPGQTPQLQRYGLDDSEVIWSVHRGRLNLAMLDACEAAGANVHFGCAAFNFDEHNKRLRLRDRSGKERSAGYQVLVGADGAGSAIRAAMEMRIDLGEVVEPLGHGYRELEIPPGSNGEFQIEANALHIWPRGRYMCIALPNTERTFTVTLFLPNQGPHPSFATVNDGDKAEAFFAREFADAQPLIPDLGLHFDERPVGQLATLRLRRWHYGPHAVLIGDAAHAMVPFHGQGMNCAFEDCTALARQLQQHDDLEQAFSAFEAERLPNAKAIQDMALENYLEMRDRVDDADYILQRQLEQLLAKRHPGRFVPRYSMVSFTRVPYAVAQARGRVQREILIEATRGLDSIEQVDLTALDQRIRAELLPLD
ncbi:FAD-dependent monooxygenase [Pseudoxanthomonas sp. CAU 1598]|uniref:FAD-dependent monooxygenase n=1 Tax=Pseudomarimonas arenosa TaxID=2774145 RepID=A0AAW3ZP77_9GAMM|nr:FAD-dependent monooxygenase [Pseudomarimonas arenosa]